MSKIGPLRPGHLMAKRWTFTKKRWTTGPYGSYLFRVDNEVMLSAVQATKEGHGYLRDLIHGIEKDGFVVVVPNPLAHMTKILKHYGFVPRMERYEEVGEDVDVWRRPT